MANIKQSEKRARQERTRRRRGQAARSHCKTMIKKAKDAIENGDLKAGRAAFVAMQSAIDRAAGKKIIPKNTVSRIKSRINNKLRVKQTA